MILIMKIEWLSNYEKIEYYFLKLNKLFILFQL